MNDGVSHVGDCSINKATAVNVEALNESVIIINDEACKISKIGDAGMVEGVCVQDLLTMDIATSYKKDLQKLQNGYI